MKGAQVKQKSGIQKAVEAFENSPTRLAEAVGGGVVRQHVEHWLKTGRVPAERAPSVARAIGGAATVEELCPGVDWAYLRELATPEGSPNPKAEA